MIKQTALRTGSMPLRRSVSWKEFEGKSEAEALEIIHVASLLPLGKHESVLALYRNPSISA